MIDVKALREDPDRFRQGAAAKRIDVDIDRAVELDARRRELIVARDEARAEQKRIEKELGRQIGQLAGRLKKAEGDERRAIQQEMDGLKARPAEFKARVQQAEESLAEIDPELDAILLKIPQPPDPDVPRGESAEDNVELRRWSPDGFDPAKSFESNRGFKARSHIELMRMHDWVDFERAVKISGSRSYVLKGDAMRLHLAMLRYAFDFMVAEQGFTPVTAPVLVREEMMVGTGFFPAGRDQTYVIDESRRDDPHGERQVGDLSHQDLFLAGTGEVGLMGLHAGEILDEANLPMRYVTMSDCFRREAGAAGKDTAGLYRIHHFQKVEQVVICRADEAESREWHKKMMANVETILQRLGLPYRLLQCCTADLGPKNADMIRHRVLDAQPRRGGRRRADRRLRRDALGEPSVRLPVPAAQHALPRRRRGGQGLDDVLPQPEQHGGGEPADPDSAIGDVAERGRVGDGAGGVAGVHGGA